MKITIIALGMAALAFTVTAQGYSSGSYGTGSGSYGTGSGSYGYGKKGKKGSAGRVVPWAETTANGCAEMLYYGPYEYAPADLFCETDGAARMGYLCSDCVTEPHRIWVQTVYSDYRNHSVAFTIEWEFTDDKTLQHRFNRANTDNGESVRWTVILPSGTRTTSTGTWHFSSTMDNVVSLINMTNLAALFSDDDGVFGAGNSNGIVNGDNTDPSDGSSLGPSSDASAHCGMDYGTGNCDDSDDDHCRRYVMNGNVFESDFVLTRMEAVVGKHGKGKKGKGNWKGPQCKSKKGKKGSSYGGLSGSKAVSQQQATLGVAGGVGILVIGAALILVRRQYSAKRAAEDELSEASNLIA